ncbi:hypothetical protein IKF74_00385 [Candidatus Saccharibacteria bacterium]|nr:hypothetical protein [Candidatus Saccharibacteria bacterium]
MDKKEYNMDVVLREARDMVGLLSLVTQIKDGPLVIVNMIKFACYYVNELAVYLKLPTSGLRYKKIYEKTRAKIKPFNNAGELFGCLEKYYRNAYKNYVLSASFLVRPLCREVGVFYCNGRAISNTVGTHAENSYIIGKDLAGIDGIRIVDISRECGEFLSSVAGEGEEVRFLNGNRMEAKDKRLMARLRPMFKKDFRKIDSLAYLNELCLVNYCSLIILNNTCRELRVRLSYIILNKVLSELKIINESIPVVGIDDIVSEYSVFLDNRELRNCMYHLDFSNSLCSHVEPTKLYGGLIEEKTGLKDIEYLEMVFGALYNISELLSSKVVACDG